MTTPSSETPDTNTNTDSPRSARRCGPRGCGPRAGGPFAGPHWAARMGALASGWQCAPVNIEETADAYVLSLFAAGLDKAGIRVSAQGDVLSIRYTAPSEGDSARSFTRRELSHGSFAREFALNARVQLEGIRASYQDGTLTVHLPKTPEAMQPPREVPVQ